MAYEYRTTEGVLRVAQERRRWIVSFRGRRAGSFPSADQAVYAVVRRATGLGIWDRLQDVDVSPDILEWSPLADNL